MGESADELKQQVDEARGRLAQDLNSLEYHVKSQVRNTFDWRVQFQQHTWQIMAAAFGAGLLFGLITAHPKPETNY
ncbi:MAG TPA: hypothetical protein VN736_21540 [Candidatus Limnocylindrales bacterium]|nr:hypothetical protein [Candidatus Limnocylindrales bacterium]